MTGRRKKRKGFKDLVSEAPARISVDKSLNILDKLSKKGTSSIESSNVSSIESSIEAENQPKSSNVSSILSSIETESSIVQPVESSIESPNVSPIASSNESSIPSPNASPIEYEREIIGITDYILLSCIEMLDGKPTTLQKISKETKISPYTLKSALIRLKQKELLIDYKRVNVGRQHGFSARVAKKNFYVQGDLSKAERVLSRVVSSNLSLAAPVERDNNIYINKSLSNRPEGEVDLELYPNLVSVGFSKSHYLQIVSAWEKLGIDIKLLARSLEYAEFSLENNLLQNVDNPLAYILTSLKRGQFGKPKGFKSRKEQIAEEIAKDIHEEAERIRKLNEQYFEDAFLVWWNNLSEEEKRRIDSLNTAIPKQGYFRELHRKEYFRRHVFEPL